MEVLDRTQAPPTTNLPDIHFPEVASTFLKNGIPVHFVQKGIQPVVEVRILSPVSSYLESKIGMASLMGQMFTEGTQEMESFTIAKKLDDLGSSIYMAPGFDSSSIILTTLEKRLPEALKLLKEIVFDATFPESEFLKLKERILQNLTIKGKNTDFVARKEFNKAIYCESYPYGRVADFENINEITQKDIKDFYYNNSFSKDWNIVVAGSFDRSTIEGLLNSFFEGKNQFFTSEEKNIPIIPKNKVQSGFNYYELPNAVQSTIRIGHLAQGRKHPDHFGMKVVDTVIGGYFGSRLMKNLREKNGFTYGIGSAWLSYRHGGVWIIQTDVGNSNVKSALEEIKSELTGLNTNGIDQSELGVLKNYMVGRAISRLETPSRIANVVSHCLIHQIPISEVENKYKVIREITPDKIQELAVKHIQPHNLLEVVAGKID